MSVPRTGLALALLAAAIFGLAVRPVWVETEAVRAAERAARAERRDARAELMRLERGRPHAPAASPVVPGAPGARLLRARVLHVLAGAPVRGVALEVQAPDPQAPPTLRLSAEGAFADLVELSGRLAAPSAGVALDQVRFTQVPNGVRLDLSGTAWGDAR